MHADLLFCPFTAPTYFEPGIPTVCTVYDLQYKTYPEFFAAAELAHREHIFIEACRRATVLTAISDYSRQCAITHGDINPERIRTIHLRMARRVVPEAVHDKAALVRLGLTQQRYLLYPANFWKHKNHEMLLTAFGMACRGQLPADIKLVCTGAPGARQDWLLRAARAMGIAERVPFLGYLPEEELGPLIANSVGLFFPSLYEGFGLPVIEGMAAGVPVACSNTTSLVEVAADAAILFDPRVPAQLAEAMSKLVEDEALRARLVDAGRQRAEEFSDSRRMAREYWDVFLYALNRENHEDSLTGVYDDGWVGPVMHVHVSSRATPQSLDFDLFAPDWLPQRRLKIQAWRGGKRRGASLEVQRGANAHWSLPLTDTGSYEIRISPTFVPAQSGNSDDQRELSAKLRRCALKHADGQTIELFSESGRA